MPDSTTTKELTAEQIAAERERLGIPQEGGQKLRAWLRYQLQQHINPKTRKPWLQADIARQCGASESTVSVIFQGGQMEGRKGEKIRLVTAQALDIPADILWQKRNGETAGH